MKKFLLASAFLLGLAATASAQTPLGTPPSGTVPPSGSTSAPKPDATIETQVGNSDVNPASRAARKDKSGAGHHGMKHKGGKMKAKSQPNTGSTM